MLPDVAALRVEQPPIRALRDISRVLRSSPSVSVSQPRLFRGMNAFESLAPDYSSRVFRLHASKHVSAFHRPSLSYTQVQRPPNLGPRHAQPC
jgi:hypothetical protein